MGESPFQPQETLSPLVNVSEGRAPKDGDEADAVRAPPVSTGPTRPGHRTLPAASAYGLLEGRAPLGHGGEKCRGIVRPRSSPPPPGPAQPHVVAPSSQGPGSRHPGQPNSGLAAAPLSGPLPFPVSGSPRRPWHCPHLPDCLRILASGSALGSPDSKVMTPRTDIK